MRQTALASGLSELHDLLVIAKEGEAGMPNTAHQYAPTLYNRAQYFSAKQAHKRNKTRSFKDLNLPLN